MHPWTGLYMYSGMSVIEICRDQALFVADSEHSVAS